MITSVSTIFRSDVIIYASCCNVVVCECHIHVIGYYPSELEEFIYKETGTFLFASSQTMILLFYFVLYFHHYNL